MAHTLDFVQRLFSMFPTGMAGVALLLFRVVVATTLLLDTRGPWTNVGGGWLQIALIAIAAALGIGLLTPYLAAACGVLEFSTLRLPHGDNGPHLVMALLNSAVLAVLGPGGYSLDAQIFGRRLLRAPRRKEH